MITITSAPPSTTEAPVPIPVSDCLQWCFEIDQADVMSTPGSFASITVDFPGTPTIPANGTEFTLWGYVFTIDDTVPYSANSFQVTSGGVTTANNFRKMLKANFFFITNAVVSPGLFGVAVITWNQCGEQDNFTGVNMDVVALEDTGAVVTVTNGVTPILVDGYKMQVLLNKWSNANGFEAIGLMKGISPKISCDEVNEVCLDFMQSARRTLFCPMPDLSTTSEIDPVLETITGKFMVRYGWTYRDENCQSLTGTFEETDEVVVINTVFEPEEPYKMARYSIYDADWPISQLGNKVQWLTNQPLFHNVAETSFCWLWTLGAVPDNGTLGFTFHHYQLVVEVYGLDGILDTIVSWPYDSIENWQVLCCNVSPQRIADEAAIDVEDIGRYQVRLTARPVADDDTYDLTQELKYGVEHDCGTMTDIYFLTPSGGIGTISCVIEEREVTQSGTEICLNTLCESTRTEQAKYAGRAITNVKSEDQVTLRAKANFHPQEVEFFRSMKISPERWIQVEERKLYTGVESTAWIARKFLVGSGGIKIYQVGEYIELVATGVMAEYAPVQWAKKSA